MINLVRGRFFIVDTNNLFMKTMVSRSIFPTLKDNYIRRNLLIGKQKLNLFSTSKTFLKVNRSN